MTLQVLFAEPRVKFPLKIQRDGRRADIGIRLNYALLAGYVRDRNPDVIPNIRTYRLYDYLQEPYDLNEDIAQADVVCVGCSTSEFYDAYNICEVAKGMGKTTIMGGIFASANARSILSLGNVDFIVSGEGEKTLDVLLKNLKQPENVTGLTFVKDGKIVVTPPTPRIHALDTVKPAYDLLDLESYAKLGSAGIYTSRGCTNGCKFCTLAPFWSYKSIARSPQNVYEEVMYLKDAGFRSINIKDESITSDTLRLKLLSERLKHTGMEFKIKARLDEITQETLDLLGEMNVRVIHTGVETANRHLLSDTKGNMGLEEVRARIKLATAQGFRINPSFILGFPFESPYESQATADLICEIGSDPKVQVYTSFYTPHPVEGRKEIGIRVISADLNEYNHTRLVSIPESNNPQKTLQTIADIQAKIVTRVGGIEPPVDVNRILQRNPLLKEVRENIFEEVKQNGSRNKSKMRELCADCS